MRANARKRIPASFLFAVTVALAAGVAAAFPTASAQGRETRERHVLVSALDKSGATVAGLTTADFLVREDDRSREVVRVEQSTAPMQIRVLVDTAADMQLALRDVRAGVDAFARRVWSRSPDTDIALSEFGARPAQVVASTRSAETFKAGVDRLAEHPGSGGYLLDAVAEAATALKARGAERPVIVVLSRESTPEFSSRQASSIEAAIRNSQAQLWTLVLRDDQPAMSDEARQRDVVLGDVSARSGGTREILLDKMHIQPGFERLADRLAAQYVVTYGRPESLIPPSKLDVSSRKSGVRVLGARWTGQ